MRSLLATVFILTVALPTWAWLAPAHANSITVYKCSATNGQVVYQGTPCAYGQQQQTMQLEDSTLPSSPVPAPEPGSSTPHIAVAPPPRVPPPTPPPTMYRCYRATDHASYLSNHGNPPPYYAPLAMTGIIPTPLGHIAPGRVQPNAAMIASHYVLVQDQCVPMTPEDTCSALRDQYNENEQKLSRAFKSDQPPLLEREKALLAQLSHC